MLPSGDLNVVRAGLFSILDQAVQAGEQAKANENAGIQDLFGDLGAGPIETPPSHTQAKPVSVWSLKERLRREKESLGLYLTGHPIEDYAGELDCMTSGRLSNLKPSKQTQWIGGLIVATRILKTKKGRPFCILTLDDRTDRVDVTLFADAYSNAEPFVVPDAVVLIEGKVEADDYSGGLRVRAESVTPIFEARQKRLQKVQLDMAMDTVFPRDLQRLKTILKEYTGGDCPLEIRVSDDQCQARLALDNQWCIDPQDEALFELRCLLGADSVHLAY